MKFKIFCVVVIAASVAIILGLALTGKDKASESVSGQTTSRAAQTAAQSPSKPAPIIPPEAIPETAADTKKARMEETALIQEQEQAAAPDQIDFLRSSVRNPVIFSRLDITQRVSVISLELNMNDEQEVMLSSYLEARYAFMSDRGTMNFATAIVNSGGRSVNQGMGNARPEITLDQMKNSVDIMALELKEITALRDKFLSELTKQQREKFDALPIAATL